MPRNETIPTTASAGRIPLSHFAGVIAFASGFVWAYWTTLNQIAAKWAHDPQYSHGYLVPLFACGLMWIRRERWFESEAPISRPAIAGVAIAAGLWIVGLWFGYDIFLMAAVILGLVAVYLFFSVLRPLATVKFHGSLWGFPVLLAGAALRWAGGRYFLEWFDFLSILPLLLGVCLLLGGWQAFRWAGPAIAFLFFMIPLPHSLESALREPLRQVGTVASTYLMQTIGLPAFSEGNVIVVNEVRIGVVEACSGLRMLMIFFALSTGVALLIERSLWERVLVLLSAVPIALISNIARITSTGILYAVGWDKLADAVFHDLAGWLMMPFALLLLWLELWALSRMFIVEEDRPMSVGLHSGSPEAVFPR